MFQFILSLFVLCAAALGAEEYEVRMHRPSKVGDRLSISGSFQSTESQLVKVDGNVVKNEDSSLELVFEFEHEAISITQAGKVSSARVKLIKIDGKVTGGAVSVLKAGDVIESVPGGERVRITVNGQPATPQQDKIARGIIPTSSEGATTDDDVFGPGRKVKVGEEWQINRGAAVKLSAQEGVPGVKPENMKGSVKFVEVTQIEGKPHLHLRGAMEMSGSDMELPSGPPGVKVDQMVMSVQMESDFPVDLTSVTPTDEMKMAMRMDGSGELERNGRKIKFEMTSKYIRDRKTRSKKLP